MKIVSMQKICRLCLQVQQRNVTPLFRDDTNDDECRHLRLLITDLCSIVILQDDNLPKSICWKCNMKLQDAHKFVNMCKISNNKLREEYEETKQYQSKKRISLTEKEQKSKERKCKSVNRSLTSIKRSLQICPKNFSNSEIYDPALSQDSLGENIKTTVKLQSDHVEENNLKIQEISLKAQIAHNPNIHYEKLSHNYQKQYLCDICSKTFYSMSGLRFHMKSHYGSKPYACQYCGKSFAIPSYKKRHERIHLDDKFFVCHICSTVFKSSNGLKYHMRTHTGEANYHCHTCSKSFTRYKYLKEHAFTHTGQKPFVCKLCGSAYNNSGSLFVHKKKCKS
ncbi:zinc finger protein 675-like [Odontomachus brunneus]|uniref:zinc finger protein 675-like n=1 Tax=Odontomachus brunneus TaxID=486640 RepID=UPI0013F195E7|nr:zinc finger protein 675-like [Odontomachus brunneus]